MQTFNLRLFYKASLIALFLLVPSFIAAGAEDEGTLGDGWISLGLAKLFYVLRFPTHTLFWSLISEGSATLYFASLLFNCMFYGLVIERFYSLVKTKQK